MVGSVYILINPVMPGYLKIGMTTRTPEERAREISQGTGVAIPYTVAYADEVLDCSLAEGLIHSRLGKYRVNKGREFFHLPLRDAIRELSDIAEKVGRVVAIPQDTVAAEECPAPQPTALKEPSVSAPVSNDNELHQSLATQNELLTWPDVETVDDKQVDALVVAEYTAEQMAPRLKQEKLGQLAAIRDVVLEVCPNCLWRMRGDGKIVFIPPAHKDRKKCRNLMTLHLAEKPMRFRISDTANKLAGGNAEHFDDSRLSEIRERLSGLLSTRNGLF